jgi:hypothetical protein
LAHPGIHVPAHAQVYFGGPGCRNNRTLAEWTDKHVQRS